MDERYPIGKFSFDGDLAKSQIESWINEIENLPKKLKEVVIGLEETQLDTPYRSGGWTVRQVVHHLADSHLNAFVRFKLALTEEKPVIKPYDEGKWAELVDYTLPIHISITLLESLHIRWVELLRSLSPLVLERNFIHPESGEVSLGKNIGIYAWHGLHHLAHITTLCNRMNW